jgi:putative DNA primase/helicase
MKIKKIPATKPIIEAANDDLAPVETDIPANVVTPEPVIEVAPAATTAITTAFDAAAFDAKKHLHPCKERGKTPLTPRGCKDASNDPAVIEAWKLQYPNCNWGLATGTISGVFVLDVDIKHIEGKYGDISLEELERTYGKLPETATVLTGGGGKHLYFKMPEGVEIPCSAGKLGSNLDIRSCGGYVIFPESTHENGRTYEWEDGLDPYEDGMGFAIAPQWLINLVKRDTRAVLKQASSGEYYESSEWECMSDSQRVEFDDALNFLPHEDRDEWVAAGMATHSMDSTQIGFDMWDKASQNSTKYDAKDCARVWFSFNNKPNKRNKETVFFMAREKGWKSANEIKNLQENEEKGLAIVREMEAREKNGYPLDKRLLNPNFPHVAIDPDKPHLKPKNQSTIQNLEYLLRAYRIRLEYAEILKRRSIVFAGHGTKGHDMEDESALMVIKSLCSLNLLSPTIIEMLPAIFKKCTVNPITDWIRSKEWDGIDRKQQLFETITVEAGLENYRNKALNIWLTQCVAAADNGEIGHALNPRAVRKFEIVLILQGKQGARKTSWIGSLLPDSLRDYVKDGMHLDPTDKDTTKKCISTWICELGEIDATFRKSDIARLKAFLSNQEDEMRMPYDRTSSKFKRRTSFCASVNGEQFLTDSTGSRRFVTLPVLNCNDSHGLDMQQIFAQYWNDYTKGAIWWTTSEFDEEVKTRNEKHNEISAIAEMVAEFFNVNDVDMEGASHFSPTKILMISGINEPKRQQVKELTEFLQSKGFRRKQSTQGVRGFTIAKLIR